MASETALWSTLSLKTVTKVWWLKSPEGKAHHLLRTRGCQALWSAAPLICRASLWGHHHQSHLIGNPGGCGVFSLSLTDSHRGLSWPRTSCLFLVAEDQRQFISAVLVFCCFSFVSPWRQIFHSLTSSWQEKPCCGTGTQLASASFQTGNYLGAFPPSIPHLPLGLSFQEHKSDRITESNPAVTSMRSVNLNWKRITPSFSLTFNWNLSFLLLQMRATNLTGICDFVTRRNPNIFFSHHTGSIRP